MKVNERELLLTIEATLTEFLPLPEVLEPVHGAPVAEQLRGQGHGEELSLRQAWDIIRAPDFQSAWLVVPLAGGRLMLAARALTAEQQQATAWLWQERAIGALALICEIGHAEARPFLQL